MAMVYKIVAHPDLVEKLELVAAQCGAKLVALRKGCITATMGGMDNLHI